MVYSAESQRHSSCPIHVQGSSGAGAGGGGQGKKRRRPKHPESGSGSGSGSVKKHQQHGECLRGRHCTKPIASIIIIKSGLVTKYHRVLLLCVQAAPPMVSTRAHAARTHTTAVGRRKGKGHSWKPLRPPPRTIRTWRASLRGLVSLAIVAYSSDRRNLHLAIWHAPTSLAMKSAQPRAQRKRHWARQVRRGQPSEERACFGVGSLGTTCERGAGGHAKREGEPGGGLSSYKIDTLSGCFLVHALRQIQTCRSALFWIQSHMHKSGRRLSVGM